MSSLEEVVADRSPNAGDVRYVWPGSAREALPG